MTLWPGRPSSHVRPPFVSAHRRLPEFPAPTPYSEAHFKTLKYRPEFPDRFDSIEQARAFCRGFFR
jgi:putative transposase